MGVFILLSCGNSKKEPTLDPVHENRLLQNQSIAVSDETRNYHLYLPENPGDASIVFLLHGNGGSSNQILGLTGAKAPFKIWVDIALQENIILVVPDGSLGSNDKQGWNDCRNDARTNPVSDDVLFINNLINFVQSSYGTSTMNVFVAGISNGALMAMRLADEIPEKLNAIAIIVASKPVNSECTDSDIPVPVLVMNGTSDPILPFNGGQIQSNRGEVFSTSETINYWINRNQTDLTPNETVIADIDQNDNSSAKHYSYINGTNNSVVEYYELTNGGHTEPSIEERYSNLFKLLVGNQNGDIEMALEVWKFFKSI